MPSIPSSKSIAYLPQNKKWALYEELCRGYESRAPPPATPLAVAEAEAEENGSGCKRVVSDLSVYHSVSCMPITKVAEDDLELLSDIVSWGEEYLKHFEKGVYACSRCCNALYDSSDKYTGPCVWPSFRSFITNTTATTSDTTTTTATTATTSAIATAGVPMQLIAVEGYNGYTCHVDELYCGRCALFIGHRFEDGKEKGDVHWEARWRH